MKKTKSSLTLSILALLLCVAMLVATTLAWFTDTATNGSNKIKAGNLDVDLIMDKEETGTYVSIAGETASIFGANSLYAQNESNDTLWEPGKTQIVYLGVQNKGTLALKYSITLKVKGGLAPALEYAVIDGAKADDLESYASWTAVKTAVGVQTGDVSVGTLTVAKNGMLADIASGIADETDYFALAVHMKEDAGNTYKGEDITIDVIVNAGQKDAEADAFDNEYDKEYEINYTLAGCTADEDNPATIKAGETVTLKFTAKSGYDFEEVTPYIINADKVSWSTDTNVASTAATLVISNPTGDVTISIPARSIPACFAAGTKITMADGGTKNIEDIQIGDAVLAYDTIQHKYYETVVLTTSENVSAALAAVTLTDGTSVDCTPTHPLLTTDGFKSVNPNYTDVMQEYGSAELHIGDMVVTENGIVAVASISVSQKTVPVYNFHVRSNGEEINCTYIANGIVVHNASGC